MLAMRMCFQPAFVVLPTACCKSVHQSRCVCVGSVIATAQCIEVTGGGGGGGVIGGGVGATAAC